MGYFRRRNSATYRVANFLLGLVVVASLVASTVSPTFAVGGTVGSIRGVVVNDQKAPIANAAIDVASASGSYHTHTDGRGEFTIIGLNSDTYTVSVSVPGYATVTIPGVTVNGDQVVSLNTITMSHQRIGSVRARSATSAFQVNATTDSTTISGARITQALGNLNNNNEQQLLLAAPGVQESSSGDISIRGSLGSELGYQFDGVNYSSPFFDANGGGGQAGGRPGGYINGITGGSGGSVQVVSGAGDATQGNIGAGVINIVPARGSYPGAGDFGISIDSPYYNHSLHADYGIATPSGRFSDYISIDESRYAPQYAPYGVEAAFTGAGQSSGGYGGLSFVKHDDVLNNFVYKFGKDNDQALQVLYRTQQEDQWGNNGGLTNASYYPYNAAFINNNSFYLGLAGINQTDLPAVLENLPGVPTSDVKPTQPEQIAYTPAYYLKVGYTKSFGASTFLQTDYYDWDQIQGTTDYTTASSNPALVETGGKRVGFDLNITHQFGANNLVTIATKLENSYPRFTEIAPGLGVLGLIIPAFDGGYTSQLGDFAVPVNGACPTSVNGIAAPFATCYIYDQLQKQGLNPNGVTIPSFGLDMHGSDFQNFGIGLRDQFSVTSKLKLDFGVREDIANYKFGATPFSENAAIGGTYISDVGPGLLAGTFLQPHIIQPRFSGSYALDPNDSFRASYGRSVEFAFAQEAGTPYQIFNLDPRLTKIPATGNQVAAPTCGSGYNNAGLPGYKNNPAVPFALTGAPGYPNGGYYFPCANYAQQVFWAMDQNLDAPDIGGQLQPTFSNYDVEYRHQFTGGFLNGWGTKATTYWRRSFNVLENLFLANGPPNPLTGQSSAAVFSTRPQGVEKTFGEELSLTTPDVRHGFSGFFTADYLSEFSTVPGASSGGAYSSDNFQPILNGSTLATGTLFRSAYLPPFSIQTGFGFTTRSGIKIQPIISANTGYPIGVGSKTVTYVNGQLQFVTSTNYGSAGPIGGPNGPGETYNSPNFVDPALPGSYLKPNIAATRGYDEPDLPGGKLSRPNGNIDLDLEWQFRKNYSIGAYISNVLNNHYGTVFQNTKYQSVATGVAGPQTGLLQANPNPLCSTGPNAASCSADFANYQAGGRDEFLLNQSYGPFLVPYNAGTTLQVYLQTKF